MPVERSVRALRWLDDVNPIPVRSLDPLFFFDDEIPAHKIVFSDKIFKLDRYRCMAEYNWHIAFPPSIFEIDLPVPAVESSVARIAVTATNSLSAGSSTLSSSGGAQRSTQSSIRSSPCKTVLIFFYYLFIILIPSRFEGEGS